MVPIGGRLAAGAAICWLLQGFGPYHDSNTEERLLCVTIMVRNRILQQPANGSSRGTNELREPASLTFPGFRGTLNAVER